MGTAGSIGPDNRQTRGTRTLPRLRNVFDQYSQPENRLTHALYCALLHDPTLVRPFLAWVGVDDVPPADELRIVQQSIPGLAVEQSEGDDGLPDLCIFTDDGWGVFFEMKAQSKLTAGQLARHAKTAKRFGFENPIMAAITVEPAAVTLAQACLSKQWREIYGWLAASAPKSFWIDELVRYFEIFEEKAIDNEYEIRGTITMFNGLQFDDKRPYLYREAKRLLRLLGDELQARPDLEADVGIDPNGGRRSAITNDGNGAYVWDFIPLKIASGHDFIRFPHLTMSLRPNLSAAAITIPNGIAGGFRSRLKKAGLDEFMLLIEQIHDRLLPVLKRSKGSKASVYATQRHYKSQRSTPQIDGRLEADLRTCIQGGKSAVKYQPQWIEAIYNVLIHKRSNIQCGIEVLFPYTCPIVRSPEAVDLFADTWKAVEPLIAFALADA